MLLIFLFIGFIIQGNWSVARVVVSILGFGACIMVAVGFKARWSASFLVLLLSVFNVSRLVGIFVWELGAIAALLFQWREGERIKSPPGRIICVHDLPGLRSVGSSFLCWMANSLHFGPDFAWTLTRNTGS